MEPVAGVASPMSSLCVSTSIHPSLLWLPALLWAPWPLAPSFLIGLLGPDLHLHIIPSKTLV